MYEVKYKYAKHTWEHSFHTIIERTEWIETFKPFIKEILVRNGSFSAWEIWED